MSDDSVLDIDVRNWKWTAAQAGGIPTLRTLRAYDRLARGLKSRGLWGKVTRLNGFGGGNLASAFTPLKSDVGTARTDTNHAFVESDYDESTGPATNGTTKYLDTGYSPAGPLFGMFMYLRDNITTSGAFIPMGCRNTATTQVYRLFSNNGTQVHTVGGAANMTTASQMVAGAYHVIRRSTIDAAIRFNGAAQSTNTTSTTASDPSANIYVFAHNAAGTVNSFAPNGTHIGGYALDDGTMLNSEMLDFYNLWQIFQTALGRNV